MARGRKRAGSRWAALVAAGALLCAAPALGDTTDTATSTWQISSASKVSILGTVRTFTARSVSIGPGTPPNNWKTVGTVILPRIPLAFGQYIDFLQSAPAEGVASWSTGAVTLALPLRLKDSASATQTFTAYLTTGSTNGYNSDGAPYCTGAATDPSYCQGTPLNSAGAFRMVAIVNIPVTGGTLGSGSLFLLEITGTLALPCVGTVCTAIDSCHVAGTCDPATGVCSNPLAANGTTCNDGNACTRTDSCQSGVCTGANPVTCTAAGVCRAVGTCDTATGICSNPAAANGTACSDGNACTRSDTCQGGACVGANPVVCTASDACHVVGVCDGSTGACSNPNAADGTACSDGSACTRSDSCQAGTCRGANPVVCTASDSCHAVGTCDPATGACSNPLQPDGAACEDANPCTAGDRCSGGTCLPGAIAVPEEVGSGVRLSGPQTTSIVWSPPARAGSYDVARGSIGSLPVGSPTGESCLASGLTAPQASDGATPPLGTGYWYLIRSQSSCGLGSYGYQGVRGSPSAPRSTGVCAGRCSTASDCPGSDTTCSTRTCVANVCGRTYAAAGVVAAEQVTGDCRRNVCDGAGGLTGVADNGDLPVDGDPCTSDVCTAGVPGHPPASSGTACSRDGGIVCDGAGRCVACVVASDCSGTDTACRTRTCSANTCGTTNAPAGTTATQTAGDCRRSVCDGSGGVTSVVDDSDLPTDGNPCTNDVCTSGTPSHPPVASGTACTSSTLSGVCDGAGSCVPCGNTVQRCCPTYPTCRPGLTCRSGLCR